MGQGAMESWWVGLVFSSSSSSSNFPDCRDENEKEDEDEDEQDEEDWGCAQFSALHFRFVNLACGDVSTVH